MLTYDTCDRCESVNFKVAEINGFFHFECENCGYEWVE